MNYARFFALSLIMMLAAAAVMTPINERAVAADAQDKCPTLRTSCPDSVKVGDPATFTANITGGDKDVTPTFNWTISAGTIDSGQGTSTITVDTKEAGGMTITATVDIGGYDRSCSVTSSCTLSVLKKTMKVAEYGKVTPAEEKQFLDKLAAELQADPSAQAYLISYEAPKGAKMEAFKAANKGMDYLVKQKQVDSSRLLPLDGGYRQQVAIELWVIPSGADMPVATPTVDPGKLKEKPAPPARKTTNKKS